jgi:hypothetical protein
MLKLKFFINESVIYTSILFMNVFSATGLASPFEKGGLRGI